MGKKSRRKKRLKAEQQAKKHESKLKPIILSAIVTAILTSIATIYGTIYINDYLKPKLTAYFAYGFFGVYDEKALEQAKLTNPYIGIREGLLKKFLKPGMVTVKGEKVESIEIQDSGMLKILLTNRGLTTATNIKVGIFFPGKPSKPVEGILQATVTPNVAHEIPEGLMVSMVKKPDLAKFFEGDLIAPVDVITIKDLPKRSNAIVSVHWTFKHPKPFDSYSWLNVPRPHLQFINSKEVTGKIEGPMPFWEILNEEKKFTGKFGSWLDNVTYKTMKGEVQNIEIPSSIRFSGEKTSEQTPNSRTNTSRESQPD